MNIRNATADDEQAIRDIYARAFPTAECKLVANLACDLLPGESNEHTYSLVAESGNELIGHIAFSPVTLEGGTEPRASILAPLAVHPDHQKQGVGSRLIEQGIRLVREQGTSVVFVYGDPSYYGRFGFQAEIAERFVPPHKLQYPFGWQALVLNEVDADRSAGPIGCVAALCRPELW